MDEVSPDQTADLIEDLPTNTALRIAESDDIATLLRTRSFLTLKPLLREMNAVDIADVFNCLEVQEIPLLFRLLPKDLAAETFVELDTQQQQALISRLNNVELRAVMEELFVDDMVDILEEMPANVVKRMLAQSDETTRAYVNEILNYPKDSAGSIMTVEFVSLAPTMTVDDAYEKIRTTAIDKETIYTCYVVDEHKRLIGIVTAKDLLLAQKTDIIGEIMESNIVYAHTTEDREAVARMLTEYGFLAIPVVDDEMRLVGIVTIDDAIDVLKEETTEDISKMAAVAPSTKPYLKTGVWAIWRNRIPWLLVLMISATFTGLILNKFEHKLALISSVLFACVPMIMDTGGNAGSQASVTVIRALALGELNTKDLLRVVWKEMRASFLLGISLSIACFAKLMLIDNLLFGYKDYTVFTCVVVSLALMCTVIIAKLVGCILPMLAKKMKLDPAVVASPFITTIVDALALILYCSLAVGLLGGLTTM
ncbi:MAG: magnesium transporter [Clostridia bacterium]|nr:magnesium transporter [Clostridia bacterium]